jgi:hypothetical protein
MLKLESSALIGRGLRRECYFHPEDENKCIKIVVAGDHKETLREQSYYRLLAKRNIAWERLARFYGNVETNLGEGAVFELIRDYNREVSKTLVHYFSTDKKIGRNDRYLCHALRELKRYLLKWNIVTISLKPQNIVFKKTNESGGFLVIIDNIGNSDFIPICNYVNWMAKRKIHRKWQRFEELLTKQ